MVVRKWGKNWIPFFPTSYNKNTFFMLFYLYSESDVWPFPIFFSGSYFYIHSVQFISSVVSNSMQPQEPQHTRPPCLSSTPRVSQTHVHWVGDAIQPSHPLSSPSPPALNLSQHRRLFKWVSSSHQVAKFLELQLHQSFQWTPRTDLL